MEEKEKEESYRACIDASSDLVYLKDEDLRYLIVNRAFREALGKTEEEILGKKASDLYPENVSRVFDGLDNKVLKSNTPVVEEVVIGNRIYETRRFPIGLRNRKVVAGSERDITDRKQAEEALVSEKMKFQTVAENAPFGMMLADRDDTIKYINPKFKELFGYDTDDMPDGKTWFRIAFPDPEYRAEVTSAWTRRLEEMGPGKKEPWTLTVTCKDGTQRIVNFITVNLGTGDIVVSCEDMTELKNHEKKLLYITSYDPLTGLPNRYSMEKAVRHAIDHARKGRKRGSLSALLFLDIDEFKVVNSTFGHVAGDEILIAFAKLLKTTLRGGDYAYRFGGDQFVVLFRGISLAEARLAAERIQKSINQHSFSTDYKKFRLDLSMGLVQIDGKTDLVTLITDGTGALYKAKAIGRNQLVVDEHSVTVVPVTAKK